MMTLDEHRARIEVMAHNAAAQMDCLTKNQVRIVLYALWRAGYVVEKNERNDD